VIAKLVLYLLFGLLLYASVVDVAQLRIPNIIVGAAAALFLPFALASHMPFIDFLWHLAAGAAVLVLGFLLFAAGLRFGGGDAKLFAALALWCGFGNLLPFFVVMCFTGGVVAVLCLVLRQLALPGWLLARGYRISSLETQAGKLVVPYAPAMAASFILVTIFATQ
jgi:prepilin peptidase CpaA